MAIYTRTGDKGKTSLFSGKRVLKYAPRVETYGAIDELNSILGVVIAHLENFSTKQKKYLYDMTVGIQRNLFHIGSYLADLEDAIDDINIEKRTKDFEQYIDEMTKKLPKLSSFILPGGGIVGATLHHARTVARRAERQLVKLSQKEKINPHVISYLNRLSDLLFTMSRFANHLEKKRETIWER